MINYIACEKRFKAKTLCQFRIGNVRATHFLITLTMSNEEALYYILMFFLTEQNKKTQKNKKFLVAI